ncbi:adenylate kinase [Mesomycoplasma conjunctivae]|uniref:Adenylate kinase n=1 Tax=Mesomycoplasma conjunctivae (strain ATCC 25834 / NCTC 10147 / HRC/581) TaxID=572263 RepID=C5J5V1_MESCH|nr:nucleoside monophosphate kinase [Mesomycoplasma conjunctivae]CAT04840.1 Adenylate kinase [Mesomycoplasma conjunctivae]VEU65896.1 adenylate kinase [Mesomycoplasma conjunctivae]
MNKFNQKHFIFLGAPGSGKGTLATALANLTKIKHISTGDIFRSKIKQDQVFAEKINTIVSQGLYVPDDITNPLVLEAISSLDAKQGFILDGYPRTLAQANFLEENNFQFDGVIHLDVAEEIIINRISLRRFCPTCKRVYHLEFRPPVDGKFCQDDNSEVVIRKDDQPEVIKKRFEIYKQETAPLIEYYRQKNLLFTVDSSRPAEDLAKEIIEKWQL